MVVTFAEVMGVQIKQLDLQATKSWNDFGVTDTLIRHINRAIKCYGFGRTDKRSVDPPPQFCPRNPYDKVREGTG